VRCLVIEPNLMLSDALCGRLRDLGFTPVSATSVNAAQEHFSNDLLAFIICGAAGGVDGIVGARRMWPHVGVIAASTTPAGATFCGVAQNLAHDAGAIACLRLEYSDEELRRAIAQALAPRSPGNAPAHILIVDDSAPMQAIARSVLTRLRARVTVADCMEDALEAIELIDIDCVVSDIFMPGMGGITGIGKIRLHFPRMPIVAISGGFEDRVRPELVLQAAAKIGADVMLAKPFDGEALTTAIRAAMHAHRPQELAPALSRQAQQRAK
jgi:CheY-like chemotaxis protein